MESVHILGWIDAVKNFRLMRGDLIRQRKLHEYPVDARVEIQFINPGQKLLLRRLLRHRNDFRVNAQFLAGLVLIADINL